jgi:hypothetical protein
MGRAARGRVPSPRIARALAFALLLFALLPAARASSIPGVGSLPPGDLHGRVLTNASSGNSTLVVPGAFVEVRGPVARTVSTDESGSFDLRLPPGLYRMTVSAPGDCLKPRSLRVSVGPGDGALVPLYLTNLCPSPGGSDPVLPLPLGTGLVVLGAAAAALLTIVFLPSRRGRARRGRRAP